MTAASAPPITEKEWQEQVVHLASIFGWDHNHTRRSIGRGQRWTTATSKVGFPDLLLWHPRHGIAAIELKVGSNRPTAEQLQVLAGLQAAGAKVMVAHPDDFEAVRALLERGLVVQPLEVTS
jgi:hypothetical protein